MPRHALTPRSTRSVARALRRGPARHDRSVLVAWLAAAVALVVCASATTSTEARPAKTPRYHGFPCPNPRGHQVTECRLGVRGTPDLSRKGWRTVFGQEVTISEPVTELAPNPAAGNARSWPLVDSLAQRMGNLAYDPERGRFTLTDVNGTSYRATVVNVRGHGCAASRRQSRDFPLLQIIAPKVKSSGGQAFVDGRAVAGSPAGDAFLGQRGGGTGCGPVGKPRGKQRALRDPAVGATAHARLSDGTINTVTEYDAKPAFGGTVYFMSNTTSVFVGGIARGMVRLGTPISTVDRLRGCDPNSDGTLTWRYVAIHTGKRSRPRLYGWLPARCRGAGSTPPATTPSQAS